MVKQFGPRRTPAQRAGVGRTRGGRNASPRVDLGGFAFAHLAFFRTARSAVATRLRSEIHVNPRKSASRVIRVSRVPFTNHEMF